MYVGENINVLGENKPRIRSGKTVTKLVPDEDLRMSHISEVEKLEVEEPQHE